MKFILWLFSIVVAIALFITASTIYLSPNDLTNCGDKPQTSSQPKSGSSPNCEKADAIIVISGGKTSARTKEAIKLYNNGWADRIIFSGAAADKSGPSNAMSMRKEALELGVPAGDILLEENANNTNENAKFTKEILEENNYNRVILTTSGYHQRRAYLEFSKTLENTDIKILNHPAKEDSDWGDWWWINPRGWTLAISELAGIVLFYINSGVN